MKKILLIGFICCNLKTFGQDMIYLANGNSVPGKITEITKDSVKFRNLANYSSPLYGYAAGEIRVAFNTNGNYLIFNTAKPFTDKEKFIGAAIKPRPFDIVVDLNGKLSALTMASETESEINDGKSFKLLKDSLSFVIWRNGIHEFFCDVDKALPYLVKYQIKIDSLLASTTEILPTFRARTPIYFEDGYVVPDITLVAEKAFQKMKTFNRCLQDIISKRISEHEAYLTIDNNYRNGIFFFHGLDSRVEILDPKTGEKRILKISEFFDELVKKGSQIERIYIANADIAYSSKFRKAPDGNYYGTVTFIQKIQEFLHENLIYGGQTKQNITFALPARGGPNVEEVLGWEVYLDRIGVVEIYK